MKRVISPALMLLLLLFLVPQERSSADKMPTIDLSSLMWKQLSPTASKTDMGPNLPEVAILVLSDDQFKKIYPSKDDAMAYLDGQSIFKRKLIKVVFCDVAPSDEGQPWILIISHTTLSTAAITAWQPPKMGKK
jgi:hypothetical protein